MGSLVSIVMTLAIVIMLVAGVIPALVDLSDISGSRLTVGELLSRLDGFGYTVYADPSGDFHVDSGDLYTNNIYPNTNSTYSIGSSGNIYAAGYFDEVFTSGGSIHIDDPEGGASFKILISDSSEGNFPLPEAFNNALVFKTTSLNNPNNMEVVFWDAENERPSLVLNEGAAARGSMFDRSLIVGSMKGAKPLDSFYTDGTTVFTNLDFATSTQGSDLGVEHDIELLGTLYTDEIRESSIYSGVLISSNLVVSGTTKLGDWYNQSLYRNSYAQMGSVFIQWGSDASTIDGGETFNLPTTFPSACISVQITRIDADSGYGFPVVSCEPESFVIDREDTIDGNQDFYWLALGF